MNVRELIEELKALPGHMTIYVDGREILGVAEAYAFDPAVTATPSTPVYVELVLETNG